MFQLGKDPKSTLERNGEISQENTWGRGNIPRKACAVLRTVTAGETGRQGERLRGRKEVRARW